MKLYTATLVTVQLQGSLYFANVEIKTNDNKKFKARLAYSLLRDISGLNPLYEVQCRVEIPANLAHQTNPLASAFGDKYIGIGTVKLRKADVILLLSGMREVESEEVFKFFNNGYYGDDILSVFGDFALCNQCIAHYIPNTILALL